MFRVLNLPTNSSAPMLMVVMAALHKSPPKHTNRLYLPHTPSPRPHLALKLLAMPSRASQPAMPPLTA